MHPTPPLSGPNKSLTIKIQQQIAGLSKCFGLTLQEKEGLNNLIFSPLLSNITNSVVSNRSEHLQNVIQFH